MAIKKRAPTANIALFEKAHGVGGRMATRWALPFVFNHGAPYFTMRTEAFMAPHGCRRINPVVRSVRKA